MSSAPVPKGKSKMAICSCRLDAHSLCDLCARRVGEYLNLCAQAEIEDRTARTKGRPKIFISYAWGNVSRIVGCQRQQLVDTLCQRLGYESWEVIRDKTAMYPGDLISDFMKSIGDADLIVVVISDKYLRSPHCMAELYSIYQHAGAEKIDFLNHIIPLMLDDAKFSSPLDRIKITEYWTQQFTALENSLRLLGEQDFKLYRSMKKWSYDVGDMLAYLCDVLQPPGFEQLAENDVAGVIEMLHRKRSRSAGA
jgi:internalin A